MAAEHGQQVFAITTLLFGHIFDFSELSDNEGKEDEEELFVLLSVLHSACQKHAHIQGLAKEPSLFIPRVTSKGASE